MYVCIYIYEYMYIYGFCLNRKDGSGNILGIWLLCSSKEALDIAKEQGSGTLGPDSRGTWMFGERVQVS